MANFDRSDVTDIEDGTGDSVMDTASNAIQVAVVSGAGGTQYAEGSSAVTATGTLAMGKNGNNLKAVQTDSSGNLVVVQSTATSLKAQAEAYQGGAAVAAGNPLQVSLANTAANATAVKVDGSAVTQPVSGTVTVTDGAGALNVIVDSGSITADTELPAAATVAADGVTPTVPGVAGYSFLKTPGANTWDRQYSVAAGQDTTGTGIAAAGIQAQLDDVATTSVTENQFANLRLSSRRALLVEGVASGTAQPISAASGAIASGALASGSISLGAVASGAVASGAIASGAYASGSVGSGAIASGAIASGAIASGAIAAGAIANGATAIAENEDVASVDADRLVKVAAIRDDTLNARSGTEGDYEQLHLDANGAIWADLNIAGAAAVTGSGNATGALRVELANNGTGLLTANPGTAANWGIYVEDAAETAGGNLNMAGAVRRDTLASSAGTTGDNATINTDANGALWVDAVGSVAHDTADANNPVKIGYKALTSLKTTTLVTNGDRVDSTADLDGALIVRTGFPLGDLISGNTTDTSGISKTVPNFTAVASTSNYITGAVVYNSSATAGTVDFRDGFAGTVLYTIPLPAGGGAVLPMGSQPYFKASPDTALYYDVSGALSTVSVSVSGFQSKE